MPASLSTSRLSRVVTAGVISLVLAYIGLWAFIAVAQFMPLLGDRATPPVLLAVGVIAGPTWFWSLIGLGAGMNAVGWIAGLVSTGLLVALTYAYLVGGSEAQGFTFWVFFAMVAICKVGAFCVLPYALTRAFIGSR
ncbi:hypothetical protein ABZ338_29995 [Streptomyces albidoflavus]|uniref:hypothetical protein n=1 Tax=Streptomyces albidoflavus TaxID=1886 RepID=UPI0005252DD9|nr:hypothetical protein [Streptomyces albidoflavus]